MAYYQDTKAVFSKTLDEFFYSIAELSQFAVNVFKEGVKPPYEFREVLNQCYEIGIKSLFLVSITGFILGLVLVMQSRPTMIEFGAGAYLPAMSSISIIREIGPLVTALICAGKIGSGISAELGSMKVPVLTIYADFVSLIGAFSGSNIKDDMSLSFFFNRVFESLHFTDILPSTIKTFFFGFMIGLVGCTKGYNSKKGTEGVGKAANSSVVIAMVGVIIIDMVVTQITSMLGYL